MAVKGPFKCETSIYIFMCKIVVTIAALTNADMEKWERLSRFLLT